MSQINATGGFTLSALFQDKDDAQDAADRLVELGLPQSSVRVVPGYESDAPPSAEVHQGFFESLANFFMPEEDRYSYAEGLQRGGYLVTVSDVPAKFYDAALDILDDEGAVNLEEQEEVWRGEGWAGYSAGDSDVVSSEISGAGSSGKMIEGGDEEVIPVVEEELRIGKRDVNHGRIRVRSYVREEPVSEQVLLREESISVERRPVDRELGVGEDAFQDRTIEAEEHAEEAVVEKRARVVEEVAIRKESTSREETVSDTVKRTEVEVEDQRSSDERGVDNR